MPAHPFELPAKRDRPSTDQQPKPSARRARHFERRLHWVNRPLVFVLFAVARRLGQVVTIPGVGRFVNDPGVARAILLAPDRFNSHDRGSFGYAISSVLGPNALINMDGPDHLKLKRDLLRVFSNRYVNEIIDATTGPILEQLRADLVAGETVDFAAFMRQYGCAMACAMMGVKLDPSDAKRVHDEIFWLATEIMALAGTGRVEPSARQKVRIAAYVDRLAAYIRKSYDRDEGDDRSVTRRLRAQGFDFEAVRGLVTVVLIGATELVIYGLPRSLAVLTDSGAWPALRSDPERLAPAIDEALRLTTPSNVILRAVAADCEVLGHHFRRGQRVLVAFRNIMRQPERFADPDRFDLERKIPTELRSLPFGAGVHTCLGMTLTLAEMRQVLQMFLSLDGRLEITGRSYNRGKLYPGYARLMIRLAPRA